VSFRPLPLVSLVDLHKAYHAGVLGCRATVEVLRGVTLRVHPGECVTVDADAGGGKTTLLFCAAGMLRPDRGAVHWPALPPRAGRPPAGIAYAGDRAPPYPFLTVREALAYAASVRELHEPGEARDAESLLRVAELREVEAVRIGLLGRAQLARLAVATALVSAPRLLLVDDLQGGADAAGRRSFAALLRRVADEGVGVLWAARALPAVDGAAVAYRLERGRLTRTAVGALRPLRRLRRTRDDQARPLALLPYPPDAAWPLRRAAAVHEPAPGERDAALRAD
jgi:ABC-type multidrug transport system ATPase subunit